MKILKTYEGFFDFFRKKKDTEVKKTSSKKPFTIPFFSKEDDALAQKIYNSLKLSLESGDGKAGEIGKYADYKRTISFTSNSNVYNIAIQKSSSPRRGSTKLFIGVTKPEYYTLVINNKQYNVSEGICKKIWDLLNKTYSKSWKNKEQIEKDFE
jgi:hypothetical protein